MSHAVTLIGGPDDSLVVNVPEPWPRASILGPSAVPYHVVAGTDTATFFDASTIGAGTDPYADITVGPVGPQGPEGPQGNPGPQGDPGVPIFWAGAWTAPGVYSQWNVVTHDGGTWMAVLPPTTGVVPASPTWELLLQSGAAWRGAFSETAAYQVGDMVVDVAKTYIATALIAPSVTHPAAEPLWQLLGGGAAGGGTAFKDWEGAWDGAVAYETGDVVRYNGSSWRAVHAITAPVSGDGPAIPAAFAGVPFVGYLDGLTNFTTAFDGSGADFTTGRRGVRKCKLFGFQVTAPGAPPTMTITATGVGVPIGMEVYNNAGAYLGQYDPAENGGPMSFSSASGIFWLVIYPVTATDTDPSFTVEGHLSAGGTLSDWGSPAGTAPPNPAPAEGPDWSLVAQKGADGATGTSVIEGWNVVGAPGKPAYLNGWSSLTGGYSQAAYKKYPDGRVRLRGIVTGGPIGTPIFTLPVGYRPTDPIAPAALVVPSSSNSAFGEIRVSATGDVIPMVGTVWYSLDGIEFDTGQTTWPTGPAGPTGPTGPAGPPGGAPIPIEAWHSIGAAGEPAFVGGWVNFGATSPPIQFKKYPDGKVRLQGIMKDGAAGTAFTLPVGYRPSGPGAIRFHCPSSAGSGQVDIDAASGAVAPQGATGGAGVWVDLSSIEFDTGQATWPTGPAGPAGPTGPAATDAVTIEPWHYIGTTVGGVAEPPFQNGWTNYGGGYGPAAFRKYPDGKVRLRGLVKSGAQNAAIFTLPAGYRPVSSGTAEMIFPTVSNELFGEIRINVTSGIVTMLAGSNLWISLDGIEFETDKATWPAGPKGDTGPIGPAGPEVAAVVSALPASPSDGQVALWRTTVAALGSLTRRMRYDTGLAKWEQMGCGGKKRARVVEMVARTNFAVNGSEHVTAWRNKLPAAAGDLIEARWDGYVLNTANNVYMQFITIDDLNTIQTMFPSAPGEGFYSGLYRNTSTGATGGVISMHGWARLNAADIRAEGSVLVGIRIGGAANIDAIGSGQIATTVTLINHGQVDA